MENPIKTNLNMETSVKKESGLSWQGFSTKWYLIVLAVFMVACYLGKTPGGWLGAFTFATVIGLLFNQIGDRTPIIKDYLGGGPVAIIFGGSLMVYFGLVPEQTLKLLKELAKTMDIYTFIIGGIICGAILGMERKTLVKAGALFFVPVLGGLAFAVALAGLGGAIMGYGAREAIYMIAFPIMGGGIALGAVPMAEVYNAVSPQDTGKLVSLMMPALGLGNILAIIAAGLMDRIGKIMPALTGNGVLTRNFKIEKEAQRKPYDVVQLGMGFVISGAFIALGCIFSHFTGIHYFVTTILLAMLVKVFDLIPEEIIEPSRQWFDFIAKNGIPAILIVVGMVNTDMNIVIQALTFKYIVICVLTIAGATLGAGLLGKLVGFFPIESSITAGMCMANMGGSGDLATLAASKRMELMPFAQISSRLGGAVVILIAGFVVRMFGLF